jgi:dolichyl-phosphate-mannose-protein mannosyltransferase
VIAALRSQVLLARLAYRDAAVAAALGTGSFALLFYRYWDPPEKIFDEVYFPRAAEEYLTRQYIYENTHPPVTKLLITLSVMLFGGMHGGDNSYGWRFLDVLFGALAVVLLFVLARRITRSTSFGAYAAALFAFDGMHFVQSRIATPESFVVCFSLATLYAFCRYWDAVAEQRGDRAIRTSANLRHAAEAAVALLLSAMVVAIRFPHETVAARIVAWIAISAGLYALYGLLRRRPAGGMWLVLFAFSGAVLVASKWYGVMAYGVAFVVVMAISIGSWAQRRATAFPVDLVAAWVVGTIGLVYALSYIPQFVGLRDLPNLPPRPYTLSDIVTMQVNAFLYHDHLRATHPYASVWWQWPLDLRPILYYARYGKGTASMIYSLPNPLILWPGVIYVPIVAWLGWKQRNRGYVVVIITYLLQWLPWMFSPRIAFAYHFYVDIPLVALCNAIAMQWLWNRWKVQRPTLARSVVAGYLALVVAAFAYFYPILAAVPISNVERMARMWLPTWS